MSRLQIPRGNFEQKAYQRLKSDKFVPAALQVLEPDKNKSMKALPEFATSSPAPSPILPDFRYPRWLSRLRTGVEDSVEKGSGKRTGLWSGAKGQTADHVICDCSTYNVLHGINCR